MKNFFVKIKSYIVAHKIISTIIIIAIIGAGYWGYNNLTSTTGETQYVTTTVKKGTIVASVDASGQVESSSQVNLTSSVSGKITYVGIKAGDKVTKGQTLFSIDNTDAKKTVRDAEINLQNAELALSITKAQNQNTDTNQQTAITNAYNSLLNSSFEAIPNNNGGTTTTNLPAPTISGNYTLGKKGVINIHFYTSNGGVSFGASGLTNGNSISSSNSPAPIGDSGLFLTLPSNYNSITNTDWVIAIPNTNASNYVSNYNAYQSALQTQKQSSSDSDVGQLNIQSEEISVTKAENSLQDAKDALANYYVTAPFSGTIASVGVEVGDTASGTLGSIITNQEIATLSLNEVDVAKIKLGEKATVSFDAISDLTMTGIVAQIDTVGTVSSGVVTYTVKIVFDTENDLVKPGMSVSAAIITDSATDALIVPSSAIKTQGTTKYVQMFSIPLVAPATGAKGTPSSVAPNKVTVEVGISDDTNTQIISGIKNGDQVVLSTATGTTTSKTSTTKSLLSGGSPRM